MKKRVRLFLTFFAIIFLISGFFGWTWWNRHHQEVEENLRTLIIETAAGQLNGRLEIDRLYATFPPAIQLEGVRIIGEDNKTVINAPQAEITIHYLEALRGNFGAGLVDVITLESPQISLIEDEGKKWNLESLIKTDSTSSQAHLNLTVEIKDGAVYLERLENVQAFLGLEGSVKVTGSGNVDGTGHVTSGEDKVQFEVIWKNDEGKFTFSGDRLHLSNGNLAWLPSQEPSIRDWQGSLDNYKIEISRNGKGEWFGTGKGFLKNAGLSITGIPFAKWNGEISGSDKEIAVKDLQGLLNGEPLQLDGKISLIDQNSLDMIVQSTGFQISQIPLVELPPVKGVVRGKVKVTGNLEVPILDGDLYGEQLEYEQHRIGDIHALLKKEEDTLQIAELDGKILGGKIQGKGVWDWKVEQGEAQVEVFGIDLSQAPTQLLPEEIQPIGGRATGTVNWKGSLADFQSEGNFSFDNGQIAGIALSSFQGNLIVREQQIDSFQGSGQVAGGTAEISNTSGSQWTFIAQDIHLEQAGILQKYISARGIFSVQGQLNSANGVWNGSIQFIGRDGELAYQPFDTMEGLIVLPGNGIARLDTLRMVQTSYRSDYSGILEFVKENGKTIIKNAESNNAFFDDGKNELHRFVRSHEADGWISLDGSDSYLHIISKNIRAENFIPFLPDGIYLSGNIDNDLIISGGIQNPQVKGNASLHSGSIGTTHDNSVLLEEVSVDYQRQEGIWNLTNGFVKNWNLHFYAEGQVSESGRYDFNLHDGVFDLERPLMWKWPYPVSGLIDFSGHLKGQGMDYGFEVLGSSPKILANGQSLDNFKFTAFGDEDQIQISEISLNQGEGKYVFEGKANGPQRSIFGNLKVTNAHLSVLLPVVNLPVPELEGTLNGDIVLDGKVPRIGIRVTGEITDGTFRKQQIKKVEIDAEMENKAWQIHKLSAYIGEEGFLAAEGGIDQEGKMDIQVAARDIDASLLPDLAYQDLPLRGKLQIASQISGTLDNPEVALSGVISPGNFGGTDFDDFHALFILKDHKISVEQMAITKGPYQASAYGTIPLSALLKEDAAREEEMDLTLQLDNANLSILPAISPVVTSGNGEMEGNLKIRGTLAQPLITGKIGVTDGTISFSKVKKPLEDIQLEVEFLGSTFMINEGHAKMGKGMLTLTGQGGLAGTSLVEYQASVKAEKLEVDSPYYKGPLDGDLKLVSGVRRPVLEGSVNLEKVTISIPVTMLIQDSGAFYLPTVGLNIQINVGEKVRFYDPVFYDLSPRGELRLRRTLQNPALEGYLEANSGRIWYFGTQFQVVDAKADFQGFQGVIPTVKLDAQYRMVNTLIMLHAEGPATQMEFTLSSEPSMTPEEIRNLLLFKTDQVDINSPEANRQLLSSGALAILEMGLQTQGLFGLEEFAKEKFGIDEIQVTQVQFYDEKTKDDNFDRFEANYGLRIGKALGNKLYATYTISINDPSDGIAVLRYDFNRYWNISGELERYESKNRYQIFLRGRFW